MLLLGDIQYPAGELKDSNEDGGYTGTWSVPRERTWPAPGNHEWRTRGAAGYREFFADRTGDALVLP